MGMYGILADTISENFYPEGYVIEYKTPSGKGLKHIATYKTYQEAKKDFDLVKENKNKVFKRYKGKFTLLKVKYHVIFPENYVFVALMEETK
jgi:hypothetical protein